MMCGKHFTSIMFFFDEGAVLGATVRAQQGRFELKSSIKAGLTLGQETPKQCVLALFIKNISKRRHQRHRPKAFFTSGTLTEDRRLMHQHPMAGGRC
jgi:hypothetical protein